MLIWVLDVLKSGERDMGVRSEVFLSVCVETECSLE